MERSKQFHCHTCNKQFSKVIISANDDVQCPTCQEYFVEMIEADNQEQKMALQGTLDSQDNK
jgi:hypothetical protein